MRAAIIATAAAVVVALWLFSPKPSVGVSSATLATLAPISIWDAHNQAHLAGMPVQHFEDVSFVFTESGDKPAPAVRVVRDTGQRQ